MPQDPIITSVPFTAQTETRDGVTERSLQAEVDIQTVSGGHVMRGLTVSENGDVFVHDFEFRPPVFPEATSVVTSFYIAADGYTSLSINMRTEEGSVEHEFELDPQLAEQFRQQVIGHASDRDWTLQEIQEAGNSIQQMLATATPAQGRQNY